MDHIDDQDLDIVLADVIRMEDEDDARDELFMFHPVQLMCFENCRVEVLPCGCHGYTLINPKLNVGCNFRSDLHQLLAPALGTNMALIGVYFVSSWAASMFFDFHPVFIDLKSSTSVLRGVTINVTPVNMMAFIEALSKMCEAGIIPCQYLRRIDLFHGDQQLILYADLWYRELVDILCHWQKTETERLFAALSVY